MENYCRFCAEPKNSAGLLYLDRDQEKCKEIYLKLLYLNAVDVLISSDILPKTICFLCYSSLHKAYDFLDKLKKAQDKFKLLTTCFFDGTYEAPEIKEETLRTNQNYDGDIKLDFNVEDRAVSEQLVNETNEAHDEKFDTSPIDQEHGDDLKFEFDNNDGAASVEFSNEAYNSPEETFTAEQNLESSIDYDVINEPKEEVLDVCKETINIQDIFDNSQTKYVSNEEVESELKPQKKRRAPINIEDLTCHICKKVYKNKRNLRVHRENMHISKCKRNNYTCDHCGKTYLNRFSIINHIKSHQSTHRQGHPHVCKICNNSFVFLSGLRYHVKTHPAVKSFSIDKILDYYLSLHETETTSEQEVCEVDEKTKSWKEFIWVCALCDAKFTNVDEFRLHCKTTHNKCSAFSCVDCKKTLKVATFDSFVNHVRKHRKGLRNLCHYCNKTLDPDMLITHIKEHYKNLLGCLICGEFMANEETLQKHLTKYTELKLKTKKERNYTCDHCGKKFLTKLVMKEHIMNHQQDRRPHVCKICCKSFLYPSKLRKHIKMHSELKSFSNEEFLNYYVSLFRRKSDKIVSEVDKNTKSWKEFIWVCGLCDVQFTNVDDFRAHCKMNHNKCAAFSCIHCEKYLKFDTFNSFVHHVKIHWKGLRNVCHYCDNALKPDILDAHVKEHSKNLLSCQTCGDFIPNQESFQQHLTKYVDLKQKSQNKRSTSITSEELTCHICKKVYKNKDSLREHVKNMHTSKRAKNYTCDRCGKAFLSKGALTAHINGHDQVQPHVCKVCNKSFMYKVRLKNHVITHSAEKPFTCKICGRNFKLHHQLKNHNIIHTDSMPYKCKHCKKEFRFKSILVNHERLHTGAKPYNCEKCGMDFADWSNCNKHMKRKHNLDMSKKKITPEGTFMVNPKTRKIIKTDMQALKGWKAEIMKPMKRGKKKRDSF